MDDKIPADDCDHARGRIYESYGSYVNGQWKYNTSGGWRCITCNLLLRKVDAP